MTRLLCVQSCIILYPLDNFPTSVQRRLERTMIFFVFLALVGSTSASDDCMCKAYHVPAFLNATSAPEIAYKGCMSMGTEAKTCEVVKTVLSHSVSPIQAEACEVACTSASFAITTPDDACKCSLVARAGCAGVIAGCAVACAASFGAACIACIGVVPGCCECCSTVIGFPCEYC
jgi:hypothetical protein